MHFRSHSLLTLLILAACNYHVDKTQPDSAPVTGPVTFSALTQRVIRPKCLQCHAGERSRSGFDLTSYQKLLNSGHVTAGSPDESYLYELVESNQMPPPDSHITLSPTEKEIFRRWIKEGAKP